MVTSLLTDFLHVGILYVALAIAAGPEVVRTVKDSMSDTGVDYDRYSRRIIAIGNGGGILVGVSFVYLLPSYGISWNPRIVFWFGIVLIIIGGGVRQYAVRTLNQYFTNRVKIHTGHTVIDSGPYQWVRHPAYTGSLMMILGIGVVLANWASILVMMLGLVGAYSYRIPVEEQTLQEQLGKPYQEYMKQTPYRIIPYVW